MAAWRSETSKIKERTLFLEKNKRESAERSRGAVLDVAKL
jgi:hypothetical protein